MMASENNPFPGRLSLHEAAAHADLSEALLARYCRQGRIAAVKFGQRSWAVDEKSLEAFLATPRRRGGIVPGECAYCGKPFTGPWTREYCGGSCRTMAYRRRKREAKSQEGE